MHHPMKLKRLKEWHHAVADARTRMSWLQITRAIISALSSGSVSQQVWAQRIKICNRCPIYRHVNRTCGPRSGRMLGLSGELGCGCYVPFMAKTAIPYVGTHASGCWGKSSGVVEGW